MSKYAPLAALLKAQVSEIISFTFKEIEDELGFKLPPSAYQHRAWWSNNPTNNVMTKEWLAVGFQTEQVDMETHSVVFRKTTATQPPAPSHSLGVADESRPFLHAPISGRHPLRSALKGTLRIVAGTDLTLPADPEWADAP